MFSHLRELRRNLCVVWLASTKYSHCNWKAQFHEKRRKNNKRLDCKFFSTFAIIPGIAIVSWRQIAEVSLKLSSIRRQAAGALQLVRFSNWLHRAGWETWLHYILPYPTHFAIAVLKFLNPETSRCTRFNFSQISNPETGRCTSLTFVFLKFRIFLLHFRYSETSFYIDY